MAIRDEFKDDLFEREPAPDEPRLIVDVDGFEGPLDLLLELARRQKLDLARISILALAEQYLVFIEEARAMRLELAADYLVMAAWLAYLKSRMLLPEKAAPEEPSAADLASDLARRLRRLEALRLAARQLEERDRLGRQVFARGRPEPLAVVENPVWQASLFDLLTAYAKQRQKQAFSTISVGKRFVWSLADAREALHRLVGHTLDWASFDNYLLRYVVEPSMRTTVRASAFAAALEMVREGHLDLRQEGPFAPIMLRARESGLRVVQG